MMCTDLLAGAPDDHQTLRLLALIAYQDGQAGDAVELAQRAISAREDVAEYHSILANSLRKQGRLSEAASAYRRAIELAPSDPSLLGNLGTCLFEQRNLDDAVDCYARALELSPNLAVVHYNLGNVRQLQRRHTDAIESYSRALALDPQHAGAHTNLGAALYASQRIDEAIVHYRRAIELEPRKAEAHNNLGVVFHDLGEHESAIECYDQAIAIAPDYLDACVNLGSALKALGNYAKAVECYRRVLEKMPTCAEAHNNLGVVLQSAGSFDEAAESYQRAIELRPDYAEAYSNSASLLRETGRLGEAADKYRAAVQLQPDLVEAHVGLADTLSDMNAPADAMREYARALSIAPNHAEARFARSLAMLRAGDFERGWDEFEWRWKTPQLRHRELPAARWNGEPLEGQTILIHAEQGLGDTIQFARYLRLVKQRGGSVIFACQRELHPLFDGVAGIDDIATLGEPLPEFDFHASLLGLPRTFGTSLETIPNDVPYLRANTPRVDRWQQELSQISGKKVGICWQGNPDYRRDHFRSFPLAYATRLAAQGDITLVSLQRRGEELSAAPTVRDGVVFFQEVDEDGAFVDTAAIISNLDLVISCDTSVAHLAGAMGVTTWVALESAADWRWLADREDSPWYPTMRLFRQTTLGDWNAVFDRMADALRTLGP